jgi:lipid II:glycine glycyltransferase (peptidoglycan interpeptide bridge formation enzyme)
LPLVPDVTVESVANGETVFVDLSRPADDLAREVRPGHSSEIRRMRKDGFVVTRDVWDDLDAFAKVYRDTMRRVEAAEGYYYQADFFRELRAALGDCLHLFVARAPQGDIAAASLFSVSSGIVQYLYSGTVAAYAKRGPSKLVLAEAISWAKDSEFDVFHLGGGVGGHQDSLFKFKAGFSGGRCAFNTVRWVVNPDAYAQLTGTAWDSSDLRVGFFPRYRAAPPIDAK